MRCRLRFTKHGAMRYLSHLDLMRLMERAVRRAGLPVSFTCGFNPHPRMAILAALPVGTEGDDELMELRLDEPIDPDVIRERLNEQLVCGIRITRVEEADAPAPAELWARYEIDLPEGVQVAPAAAQALMAQPAILVEFGTGKNRRRTDLRPFLSELVPQQGKMGFVAKVCPQGTARPEAVLTALLGEDAVRRGGFRIRRTSLSLSRPVRVPGEEAEARRTPPEPRGTANG
jgi:radical SAM-linked protein